MRVLFDHNVPKQLRRFLSGHDVSTSREMGWDAFKNGDLLSAAEANGFEVLVTGDKNLSYQQNLESRKLGLIVLGATDWNILNENTAPVVEAVNKAGPGTFQTVMIATGKKKRRSTQQFREQPERQRGDDR